MYGVSQSVQTLVLLKSIGVGFIIGFIYNAFISLRIIIGKNGKTAVFIQDMIFAAAAALITFIFAFEANYGIVRFYMLAGEGIGFCLFYLLPGAVISSFLKKISSAVRKLLRKCIKILKKPFLSLRERKIQNKREKATKVRKKTTKIFSKFSLKLLHKKG